MSDQMELSKKFEEIIIGKMKKRLSQIKWGENCESLEEALTFTQAWILGGIAKENAVAFFDYILRTGFTTKGIITKGEFLQDERRLWHFNFNTKNRNILQVGEEFNKSLKLFKQECENWAYAVVSDFANNQFVEIHSVYVGNSIAKKAVADQIGNYNRSLLTVVSAREPSRYQGNFFIEYEITNYGDVLVMSKSGKFYDWIKNTEGQYLKKYRNSLAVFFSTAVAEIRWHRGKAKTIHKAVAYIRNGYIHDYQKMLQSKGLKVDLLPQYPEDVYFSINTMAEDLVPIYIEVPKPFAYMPIFYDNDYISNYINNYYWEFCSFYR